MNWNLSLLIGQAASNLSSLRERTELTSNGNPAPDSALERTGGMNFLGIDYWVPEQASTSADSFDYAFAGLYYISMFFFVGIVVTAIYFCIKYRRVGKEIHTLPSPSHNTTLEIVWSVIPSMLMAWMFYHGAMGYFNMRTPHDGAEEIQVMASQFNWVFTYPDGDSSSELHLVRDRPAKLILQSKDVLHSLYVPVFRQKMDVVPGRYTYFYVLPTLTGKYRLACAEYCGEGHSKMRTLCEVHKTDAERKSSTKWIKAAHKPWENGERIYKIHCSGCHKINGEVSTGPPLNKVWGKGEETMITGSTVKIDRQYIQDSIWNPDKDVVAGFGPVTKMNSFQGILDEKDINDVIAFLKYMHDPKLANEPEGDEAPVNAETEDTESDVTEASSRSHSAMNTEPKDGSEGATEDPSDQTDPTGLPEKSDALKAETPPAAEPKDATVEKPAADDSGSDESGSDEST